ncbi:hypothetical protein FHS43_002807 [Streptosporangium becharense]|uniref:Uncharacterized protein n=1 Tax=Streptosporangium becharense TaxID=1816182 RepID=A0A7W9IKX2_9ACTN|nr:hypothetical protein [Streptosporangium becharense]MBB2911534.1 hypothetical protein [Streptosporangium becharense]MBB5822648.1 hypothetical protein [Streptosporangium becharense]
MDAESSICLSDLIPALRWSRPQQVAEALADSRLPAGWWSSVTLSRALGTAGLDWICDRLARLSLSRWDHLPLSDVLPALHVHTVDPTLPGWPEATRSAISGLGGWSRLRRLTAADLAGPAMASSPQDLVTAMFREVLGHVPGVSDVAGVAGVAEQEATAEAAVQALPQVPAQAPPQGPVPAPVPPQAPQPREQRQAPSAETAPAAPAAPPEPKPVRLSDYPLVGLVENMFRDWGPLERAVAVERLFAVDPISLRALAHKLNADRDALSAAQRAAEERILLWLRSPESAPLTGHMFGLTEWLGAAATEDQLVGADPAHPIEVPTLRTPLWRVLVTLMPDRRLQDGWLVVGDLGGLRERTRRLLAVKPADADVFALLDHQLGIRTHSAQAWLDALAASGTQESASAQPAAEAARQLPRRTPGANGHHHRGGQPIPQVTASGIDPRAALATLSALSGGNTRPHLITSQRAPLHPPTSPSTDPSRWQRIEVTSDHLRGGPVAVPEGYATQLGMRPGTLLSVTGPGDNAVVLVWRDQPVFDSLQPVLMRLNARPGDQVYVTVDGYRLEAQLPA